MRCARVLLTVAVGIGGIAAQPVVEIRNNTGDAEVCWYGGAPLPATGVTCQPGGKPIELPGGLSTVFARRLPNLVSVPVVVKDGEQPRQLTLLPAASMTAVGSPRELFAYVAAAGAVMPASLIPADTPVLPLRIRDRTISEIGGPVIVPAGTEASVLKGTDGRWYVVAAIERGVAATTVRDPLEVYLLTGGKRQPPIVGIAPTIAALAVFSDSKREGAKLIVTGRGWKTLERDIAAPNDARVAVLPERLIAARVAKLSVRWWTNRRLDDLATGPDPECPGAARNTWNLARDPAAPFAMTLLRCSAPPSASDGCVSVRTEPLSADATEGQVVFEGVTPGEYDVRVTYPGLPALSRHVRVTDGPQTDDDFELRYFTFFGRVTHKGQAVKARLFATVTDEDGVYRAVLPNELLRTSEFVSPCDGSPTYRMLFDAPPRENARFDIELPDTTIRAVVLDEQTRAPLRDALVRYNARHLEKNASFGDSVGKTDETGVVRIEHVDKGHEITVCAAHQEYDRRCSEPFVMQATERTVELPLTKRLALSGRIITARPLEKGNVIWYGPDGAVRESANVMPGGTFAFGKHHEPGEILTVVSSTHPLYVTRQVLATPDKHVFEIAVPVAPERSILIVRKAQDTGGTKYVSIAVGGVPVPLSALNVYLKARVAGPPFLDPGSTVEIPSILATGPVELIVLSGVISADRDPVLMPQNATVVRIPLGDATRVDVSNQ